MVGSNVFHPGLFLSIEEKACFWYPHRVRKHVAVLGGGAAILAIWFAVWSLDGSCLSWCQLRWVIWIFGLVIFSVFSALLIVWLFIAKRVQKPYWWGYILSIGLTWIIWVSYLWISNTQANRNFEFDHTQVTGIETLKNISPNESKLTLYASTNQGFVKLQMAVNNTGLIEIGPISDNQVDHSLSIGNVRGQNYGSAATITVESPDKKSKAVMTAYPLDSNPTDIDQIVVGGRNDAKVFTIKGINQILQIPSWSKSSRFLMYMSKDSLEIFDMETQERYATQTCPFTLNPKYCVYSASWSN